MYSIKRHTGVLLIIMSLAFVNFSMQDSANEATVKFVIGTVQIQAKQQTNWEKLALNSKVGEGDRIKTSLNSNVEILMPDGTVLRISENTVFDVDEIKTPQTDQEDKMKFTLWAGNIWAKFKKIVTSRQEREIESPSAVVAIRGTTLEMEVYLNQDTRVRVEEGSVVVRSKDVEGEVTVATNQETMVEVGKAPRTPSAPEERETEEDRSFPFKVNLSKFVFTDAAVLAAGIPITGLSVSGAQVYADEQPLAVLANGTFNGRIRVVEGLNTIKLTALKGEMRKSLDLRVFVNTKKPELRLSSPLVADFYNRRDYSLSGGVFDLTPSDKIKIFINNEEVSEVIGRGSFNRTIILNEGRNTITVVARDRSGNTTEIAQNLFLDTVKPILTVTQPAEQIFYRYEPPPPPLRKQTRLEESIRGVVIDPEPSSGIKRITVNGVEIKPNSDGSFESVIPLRKGENRLNFSAEDLAGNIVRDNTRVVRVPQ